MNLSLRNGSLSDRAFLMAYVLTKEPWCLVTLINMAYCCLLLFGRLIQKIVFGKLRVGEQQHIKDKFWNFIFYKFIFIFGVMNVQEMHEIVLWSTWFSVLGFLHILAQLCKDRFEYLSSSPATPAVTHAKVLLLLASIHIVCVSLLLGCVAIGLFYTGVNTFAFIAAECLLLTIRTLYVLVRYAIHLYDMHHDGVWENRSVCVYYSELLFELSALSVDFCHHLHMLLWGNIFLSMASLVICMQLRYLFYEFQRRVKRYKNYRRVVSTMEAKFPVATPEQLQQNNDDCAICWEKMESARRLPCAHMFHKACLRSWLEQDTSCPTCRVSLNDLQPPASAHGPPTPPGGVVPQEQRRRPQGRTTDRFHFDGSRYVSWLPSFSVEVTHMQLLGYRRQQQQVWTSQLDSMARNVYEVFPNIPIPVILEDLRVTRSVEVTIENIVEGRLQAPPVFSVDTDDTLDAPELHLPFVGDDIRRAPHPSAVSTHHRHPPSSPGAPLGGGMGAPPATNLGGEGPVLREGGPRDGSPCTERATEFVIQTATELVVPEDLHVGCEGGGGVRGGGGERQGGGDRETTPAESSTTVEHPASIAPRCGQDFRSQTTGSTFSSCPQEREELLTGRKNELLNLAKSRYLAGRSLQPLAPPASSATPPRGGSPSATLPAIPTSQSHAPPEAAGGGGARQADRRRELSYDAVQRRLHQS